MPNYWIYVSRARIAEATIDEVLIYLQSRNRNPFDGITGYLHREGDCFVQYVEGPAAAIARLRRRILGDTRHSALRTLRRGFTETHRFAEWDMASTRQGGPRLAAFRGEDLHATLCARRVIAFMERMVAHGHARRFPDRVA